MKRILTFITALGIAVATPAVAQDSDSWEWRVIPYLWGLNMDGDMAIGPIDADIDVSFSDILSDMDIGGSIAGQFSKGAHGFHADYTYLRLKPEAKELPFPPDSRIEPKITANVFEAGYNWHFTDAQALLIGARYISLEMRMKPVLTGPGPIDPDPLSAGPDWVDYFVGLQSRHRLGEKWGFNFLGTIGAGDSDLPWTLHATFDRRFSNDNALHMGFRVWGLDYSDNDNDLEARASLDVTMYGFVIGYEFN